MSEKAKTEEEAAKEAGKEQLQTPQPTAEELLEGAKSAVDSMFGPAANRPPTPEKKAETPTDDGEKKVGAEGQEGDDPNKNKAEADGDKGAKKGKGGEEKPGEEGGTPPAKADEKPPAKAEGEVEEPVVPPDINEAVSVHKPDSSTPPDLDKLVTEAVKKQTQTQTQLSLSDDDKETLAAFERLEKDNPAMKGLSQKVVNFWEREQAYISDWEKANPGQTFNPDDDEHSQFYSRNTPQYDEQILNKAKAQNRLDAEEEIRKKDRQSLRKEIENDFAIKEVERDSTRVSEQGLIGLIHMIDENLAKENPNGTFDAIADKIEESDPLLADEVKSQGEMLRHEFKELYKMAKMPAGVKVKDVTVQLNNGVMFNPHATITKAAQELEARLAQADPKTTLRDGRRFVTHAQFNEAVQKIRGASHLDDSSKKAAFQKILDQYYTLDVQDYWLEMLERRSNTVKQRIARYRKTGEPGKSGGGASSTSESNKGKEGKQAGESKSQQESKKEATTSTASESDAVTSQKTGGAQGAVTQEDVAKSMWGS